MQTFSILQALGLIQNQHPDEIVVYDPDQIAFHLFPDLDSLREKIIHVTLDLKTNTLDLIGESVYYYTPLNDKTKSLLD